MQNFTEMPLFLDNSSLCWVNVLFTVDDNMAQSCNNKNGT